MRICGVLIMNALIGGVITFAVFAFIFHKGNKAMKFIKHDCGDDRRSREFLMKFLLKFYLYTFGFAFLTFGVWGFAMGPFWFILLLVKWRFTKLWKTSGYSLPLLILFTIIFIAGSFVVTYFLRELFVIPLIYRLGLG
jgi:hypothetical protein